MIVNMDKNMNNNNNYFGQPQQPQYYQQPQMNQGLPGYGYPIQQPGYAPQQPYVAQTQPQMMPPQGGYAPQQPYGQPPQPRIHAQTYTPQGAYDAYANSIDADAKVEEMNAVLNLVNEQGIMDGTTVDIKDAAIAETLANRDIDAVIIQMEHLAEVVKSPEKWFPKDKVNFIPKFQESLGKLSLALTEYVKRLKQL